MYLLWTQKNEILLKEHIFEYATKSDNRVSNMKAQACYNKSYLISILTQLKISHIYYI